MKFAWNNTSVQVCLNPLFQHTFFSVISCFSIKSQVIKVNKMVNTVYTALALHSFIFLFHISMSVQFSLKFVYSTMCRENFQIYGVHIPRKCIE